ncbi:hypothetical protein IQ273_05060 [Nodosilinea sp. LEGE 07298]|uniref:hypothetical protein n=1 Tax=Nodosilinea sp. LEGE 07298 TaxID=2777970 RepID=UPI001882EA57|nr:hypothetical protein [Nodosilinea sp. LEGE 07298]MBE9108785.1 hypothetical protein [Nodosilinea sp. LEGE 07298]
MGIKVLQSKLFSSLVKPFLNQGRNRDRYPLSYLFIGTAAVAALGAIAPVQAQSTTQSSLDSAVAQTAVALPEAGRYLFGQVSQPDQIGQGYVVLERTGDRVYGALYYPSSSFDCFYGQVEGSDLAMTIVNSYDQEAYPYSLALVDGPVVAANGAAGELSPFGLDGFFALDTLSDNDHRMLDMCQSAVVPEQ